MIHNNIYISDLPVKDPTTHKVLLSAPHTGGFETNLLHSLLLHAERSSIKEMESRFIESTPNNNPIMPENNHIAVNCKSIRLFLAHKRRERESFNERSQLDHA